MTDLAPHDHGMWAAIGLYGGREDNHFYRRDAEGRIAPAGGRTMLPTDVAGLGPDIVHRVVNPTKEWTGAIHVYGGAECRPDGDTNGPKSIHHVTAAPTHVLQPGRHSRWPPLPSTGSSVATRAGTQRNGAPLKVAPRRDYSPRPGTAGMPSCTLGPVRDHQPSPLHDARSRPQSRGRRRAHCARR